jgi:hypothetical protein
VAVGVVKVVVAHLEELVVKVVEALGQQEPT